MEDDEFSFAFRRFLKKNVPDVDAARLLLRMADRPDVWWEAERAEAGDPIQRFRRSGLLLTAQDGKVRYAPRNEALHQHVETLAQAYDERPVTLIRVIYAMQDSGDD